MMQSTDGQNFQENTKIASSGVDWNLTPTHPSICSLTGDELKAHLITQLKEFHSRECLGQDISKHVISRAPSQFGNLGFDQSPDPMMPDVEVFGSSMEVGVG